MNDTQHNFLLAALKKPFNGKETANIGLLKEVPNRVEFVLGEHRFLITGKPLHASLRPFYFLRGKVGVWHLDPHIP